MPLSCIYPQNTQEPVFLDDKKTPNPARCPYRIRWKPYRGKPPSRKECCKKAYVPEKNRATPLNQWIPKTHLQFEPKEPSLSQPQQGSVSWTPNRKCPPESVCTSGTCDPKNGRPRGCSDTYRCVFKDGATWRRSCKDREEEYSFDFLDQPIKKTEAWIDESDAFLFKE